MGQAEHTCGGGVKMSDRDARDGARTGEARRSGPGVTSAVMRESAELRLSLSTLGRAGGINIHGAAAEPT